MKNYSFNGEENINIKHYNLKFITHIIQLFLTIFHPTIQLLTIPNIQGEVTVIPNPARRTSEHPF